MWGKSSFPYNGFNDIQAFRNRQDTAEALKIAATGRVQPHFEIRALDDLQKYGLSLSVLYFDLVTLRNSYSVYEQMENGQLTGRVVLNVGK